MITHPGTQRRRGQRVTSMVILGTILASNAHAVATLPPTGKRALLGWLRARVYASTFIPEPVPHPSASAHGPYVRTWYSPVLIEDLRMGRSPFRKGAAMVKELYFEGPNAPPVGYAVMRKVRSRSGPTGRGWFFSETFDGTNDALRIGRGLPVCTGCHRSGVDYLLSPFRP